MNNTEEIDNLIEEIKLTTPQLINHSYSVADDLYMRLNKHVKLLKRLENFSISKQDWISEAIQEKLKEEESNPEQCLENKYISFRVEKSVNDRIKKSVENIRKIRGSFSQKKWFIEAIYGKLNREEQKVKIMLQNMITTASNKS